MLLRPWWPALNTFLCHSQTVLLWVLVAQCCNLSCEMLEHRLLGWFNQTTWMATATMGGTCAIIPPLNFYTRALKMPEKPSQKSPLAKEECKVVGLIPERATCFSCLETPKMIVITMCLFCTCCEPNHFNEGAVHHDCLSMVITLRKYRPCANIWKTKTNKAVLNRTAAHSAALLC